MESLQESFEAIADAGGTDADRAGELVRVEARDVAQSQERAIVGVEPGHGIAKVDVSDTHRRITTGSCVGRVRESFDLGAAAALAEQLLGLVGGHGHEPGTEVPDLVDVTEPLPGDDPGRLRRLVRDGPVIG